MDDEAGVGLLEFGRAIAQLVAEQFRQPINFLWGYGLLAIGAPLLQSHDFGGEFISLKFEPDEPLSQAVRMTHSQQAVVALIGTFPGRFQISIEKSA
ncbi:MAG: hypothetical protein WBA88_07805 [Pseudaminobacter sp.]